MITIQTKRSKWNLIAGWVMLFLGGVIWVNPLDTMLALAFYIGIGFVLVGIFYVLSSMNIKSGWYLLVGVLDIVVGGILVANLGVTAATLPIIVALWCLTIGVVQVVGSIEIKRYGLPWGWSALMGALGNIFGLVILAYPVIGAVAISTVVGLYAVMFGLLQLAEYNVLKNSYRLVIDN